jgi:hypothetical protein
MLPAIFAKVLKSIAVEAAGWAKKDFVQEDPMRKSLSRTLLAALMMSSAWTLMARAAQKSCESLTEVALPNAKITKAESVAAGAFTPPPTPDFGPQPAPSYKDVPAFCRVMIEATPTTDSDIKIEVWLPAAGWNGKYRGQGNGGFAGVIDYPGLAAAVKRGYATCRYRHRARGFGGQCGMGLGPPREGN